MKNVIRRCGLFVVSEVGLHCVARTLKSEYIGKLSFKHICLIADLLRLCLLAV